MNFSAVVLIPDDTHTHTHTHTHTYTNKHGHKRTLQSGQEDGKTCYGREHDPDTMVTPLTPKSTRRAEALGRVPPTIGSSVHPFFFLSAPSLTGEKKFTSFFIMLDSASLFIMLDSASL